MGSVAQGLEKLFGQTGRQLDAGCMGVLLNQPCGQIGVSGFDRLGNGLVLVPHRLALARRLQHRTHDPLEVVPMQLNALFDQRVARGDVDGFVKSQIGLDHGLHITAGLGHAARQHELARQLRARLGRQTHGQRVQTATHLVDMGNPVDLQWGDTHPATRRVFDKTLFFQQAQGLQELAVADGETSFGRADLAEHRVLSVERPLGGGLHARVEAFERQSLRIRPRWENLENAYDIFPEAQLDRFRVAPTEGRARGVELMLRGRAARWHWHASYSLAKAEDRVDGRWLPRSRDQRHAVSADATFVPARDWQLSAAWSFHSGWPTTGTSYRLESLTGGRQVAVPVIGPAYGLRLPDYHRLDLRVTRRLPGSRGEWRVHLDLFNAYGRANLLGYLHRAVWREGRLEVAREPRTQIPFVPSLGATWEF